MSVIEKIQSGPQRRPITACVWGTPGVGKTTFAAAAPRPLIMCIERGADALDVDKLPAPSSWKAFSEDLHDLWKDEHPYKTLVIDTLDALEVLAVAHVCTSANKKTLSDFDWGGGYALLAQEWRLFLKGLEVLRDKRDMNVILVAHEHRKTYADPELGSYEMYRPKLQDKVWALTNEWCDAVLFAQFDTAMLEKKGQRDRAIVSGRRVLRTQRGTGFLAKNRYGLEPTIDLDWKTFEAAAAAPSVETLRARLGKLLALAGGEYEGKATAFLEERGETVSTLRALIERMQVITASAPDAK